MCWGRCRQLLYAQFIVPNRLRCTRNVQTIFHPQSLGKSYFQRRHHHTPKGRSTPVSHPGKRRQYSRYRTPTPTPTLPAVVCLRVITATGTLLRPSSEPAARHSTASPADKKNVRLLLSRDNRGSLTVFPLAAAPEGGRNRRP